MKEIICVRFLVQNGLAIPMHFSFSTDLSLVKVGRSGKKKRKRKKNKKEKERK